MCSEWQYVKWYRTDGKKSVYIPKCKKQEAMLLAQNTYKKCLLDDCMDELEILEKCLDKCEKLKRRVLKLEKNPK